MDACRRSSPQNSASGALLDKVASYLVQHLSERMPLRDQASSSRHIGAEAFRIGYPIGIQLLGDMVEFCPQDKSE